MRAGVSFLRITHAGAIDLIERRKENIRQMFHARGRDLHHRGIAKAIYDDARQQIAFGMHEPIIGLGEERFAQAASAAEPVGEECPSNSVPDGPSRRTAIRLLALK